MLLYNVQTVISSTIVRRGLTIGSPSYTILVDGDRQEILRYSLIWMEKDNMRPGIIPSVLGLTLMFWWVPIMWEPFWGMRPSLYEGVVIIVAYAFSFKTTWLAIPILAYGAWRLREEANNV